MSTPSDLTGLVTFSNKGEIITGYIKQMSLNVAKEKAATYTLIVKEVKSQNNKRIVKVPSVAYMQ